MSKPSGAKARSIFEEVGAEGPAPTALARAPRGPQPERGAIVIWLAILFALVVAMIAVGGLTRLRDAGLSITEWAPITGALPPADEAAWAAEFEKYRAIPQAQLVNPDMTLTEFKSIYWWEWGHRQLGRLIGAVWAVGFLWFVVRRRIPPGWTPRLLALGALGGLQGALGWWMVSSGLGGQMIAVASERLAIHLGLAFIILGLIAWFILLLRRTDAELLQARRQRTPALIAWANVLLGVAFLQILLGALVAGIDAGRAYPEWPLMAGAIFPPDAFNLTPVWRNFVENAGLVQFNHRLVGYVLFVLGLLALIRARRSALTRVRAAFHGVFGMMVLQVVLGVVTVLTAASPHVAITHQFGAVVLWVLILRARFAALYPPQQKIARA